MEREIREELVRVRTILDEAVVPRLNEIKASQEAQRSRLDDHHVRIDRLEQKGKRPPAVPRKPLSKKPLAIIAAVVTSGVTAAASYFWPAPKG